jgi:hypothetical protein
MNCQRCKSNRVAEVRAKSSDMNSVSLSGKTDHGYVPGDMGIGGGDYVEFNWCLDCGQIQDTFPVGKCEMEGASEDE